MSAETILTLANGHGVDLNAVTSADVDFATWGEHVAKEARFNGATPDVVYYVGQHLCIGTDAMLRDGQTEAAPYFIVHDLPEAIWKDDPTPKKRTIAQRISQRCGVTSESVLGVLKEIDDEHERAVHEAAGLPWPIPECIHRVVKLYDVTMFVTEWRDLMHGIEHPNWGPYEDVPPLAETITPWPWRVARNEYIARCFKLLPSLKDKLAIASPDSVLKGSGANV